MDTELKLLGIFSLFVIFLSTFTPYGYAIRETTETAAEAAGPVAVNTISSPVIEMRGRSSTCNGEVFIDQIDWADYENLSNAMSGNTIDGFGSFAQQQEEETMNTAGLAEDPSVNRVSNKFLLANGKPVMLFDAMQNRVINPNEDGCWLSRAVVSGPMSYMTKIDLNTRFCAEYGDADCMSGHLNEESAKTAEEVTDRQKAVEAVVKEAQKDNPSFDEIKRLLTTGFRGGAITPVSQEELNTIELAINSDDKALLASAIDTILNRVESSSQYALASNPLNIFQSNETGFQLAQAKEIWQFPEELRNFVGFLGEREKTDKWYGTMSLVWGVAMLATAAHSFAAARLAAKITKANSVTRALEAIQSGRKGAEALAEGKQSVMSILRETKNNPTRLQEIATHFGIDKAEDVSNALDSILTELEKAKSFDEIRTALSADKAFGPKPIKRTQIAGFLRDNSRHVTVNVVIDGKTQTVDGTSLAVLLGDAEKYKANLLEPAVIQAIRQVEAADLLGQGVNQVTATVWDMVGLADGLAATPGSLDLVEGVTMKLDELATFVIRQEFYKYPGAASVVDRLSKKKTAAAGSWRTLIPATMKLKGAEYILNLLRGTKSWFYVGQGITYVEFAFLSVPFLGGNAPKPFYKLRGLQLQLSPQKEIIGNDPAFLEVGKTSHFFNEDMYPDTIFTEAFKFMNVDLRELFGDDVNPVTQKFQNIGDYVIIVDQDSRHSLVNQQPVNTIFPVQNSDGENRWSFLNLNPDITDVYAFEHPREYYVSGDGNTQYSGMAAITRNVDLSGLSLDKDLAQFSPIGEVLTAINPKPKYWIFSSLLAGGLSTAGVLTMSRGIAGRGLTFAIQFIFARLLAGETSGEIGEAWRQLKYGPLVDVGYAYNSGELCKDVRGEYEDKIKDQGWWMWGSAGAMMVSDVIQTWATSPSAIALLGVTPGGKVALGVIIGANIAFNLWNWHETKQYDELKLETLEKMKKCKETNFDILAWQKYTTEEGKKSEITGMFDEALGAVSSTIGSVLSTMSPETQQAVNDVATYSYDSVMALDGEVKGRSMANVFGTEIYKVFFSKEASIKWMLGDSVTSEGKACDLSLCYLDKDGVYHCMRNQGYVLYDEYGNVIFEGPQNLGGRWNNLKGYYGIPQKVIDIKKKAEPLMNIYTDRVEFADSCIGDRVKELSKLSDIEKLFGKFEAAYTDNAVIWTDGTGFSLRFLHETVCGTDTYGEAQIVDAPNGHILLNKDGSMQIIGASGNPVVNCTFTMGTGDFMSFENAKLTPGKASATENYLDVLHMFIYNLGSVPKEALEPQKDSFQMYESCVTDQGEQGYKIKVDFTSQYAAQEQQWNDLASEICVPISGWHSDPKNGGITYDPTTGTYNFTDAMGNTYIYNNAQWNPNGWMDMTGADGQQYKGVVQTGADGIPQFVILDSQGNVVGNPLPLLYANGLGGAFRYDANSGAISIDNEFAFPINSNFQTYGALASPGFAVPGSAPWGSRVKETEGAGTVPGGQQPNLLAQLPWTPGYSVELIVFILILFSGLMFVRIRYRRTQ